MSNCAPPCNHDRLLHDTFGCKICRGSCGISIVQLTENLFSKSVDSDQTQRFIELGKALDRELDRKDEHKVKIMIQRAVEEQGVEVLTE